MKDELISFETAKLAKEKGFDWPCDWYLYVGDTGNNINHTVRGYNSHTNDVLDDLSFSAPTQSLLQRWLRDKHKIHVQCNLFNVKEGLGYYWMIFEHPESDQRKRFNTYEEALEIGLQEALKLI